MIFILKPRFWGDVLTKNSKGQIDFPQILIKKPAGRQGNLLMVQNSDVISGTSAVAPVGTSKN